MIGDEIDPEEFSEVAGKKFISAAVLRQSFRCWLTHKPSCLAKKFSDAEKKKLGVDKVKLMEQRYCLIYPNAL